jgi:hypothetical protein
MYFIILLIISIIGIYFIRRIENYIVFQTDEGDDTDKYYVSPQEVMNDTLYVTNPESLYAGFSMKAGEQKQQIPIGPITDRLGRQRDIPGLPGRDVIYTIREDSDLASEGIPLPGSTNSTTDIYPITVLE